MKSNLSPIRGNGIGQLHDKIFGSKQDEFDPEDIAELHDYIMQEYGWIPIEQFKELPISTMLGLCTAISKRKERERQEMDKMKRGKK